MSKPIHYIKKLEEIGAPQLPMQNKDFLAWCFSGEGVRTNERIGMNIKSVYYSSFPMRIDYGRGLIKESYLVPSLMPMN